MDQVKETKVNTKFYTEDDIKLYKLGINMKTNAQGYTITPYGNVKGKEVYTAKQYAYFSYLLSTTK